MKVPSKDKYVSHKQLIFLGGPYHCQVIGIHHNLQASDSVVWGPWDPERKGCGERSSIIKFHDIIHPSFILFEEVKFRLKSLIHLGNCIQLLVNWSWLCHHRCLAAELFDLLLGNLGSHVNLLRCFPWFNIFTSQTKCKMPQVPNTDPQNSCCMFFCDIMSWVWGDISDITLITINQGLKVDSLSSPPGSEAIPYPPIPIDGC